MSCHTNLHSCYIKGNTCTAFIASSSMINKKYFGCKFVTMYRLHYIKVTMQIFRGDSCIDTTLLFLHTQRFCFYYVYIKNWTTYKCIKYIFRNQRGKWYDDFLPTIINYSSLQTIRTWQLLLNESSQRKKYFHILYDFEIPITNLDRKQSFTSRYFQKYNQNSGIFNNVSQLLLNRH